MAWIRAFSGSAAVILGASAQAIITVDFTYPLTAVAETYLSLNIDSGSLYNDFDLTDPILNQLVANLARAAPVQVRFGGSAANDVTYTGSGGARGNCSSGGVTRICVDDSLWDEINAFANRTGVGLVWDLPINPRTPGGAWNFSNSEALIQRTAAAGYVLAAWQLGNEEGAQLGGMGSEDAYVFAGRFHRCHAAHSRPRGHDQTRGKLFRRPGWLPDIPREQVVMPRFPSTCSCRSRPTSTPSKASSRLRSPASARRSMARIRAATRSSTRRACSCPHLVRARRLRGLSF